jgi:transcription initiation factor TFIIIB Brf1 subunit/transcription initiation factor TFIIB
MKAEKIYTNDVALEITAKYVANPCAETVKEIAASLGVSERSAIAKLSSLGVYVKKVYITKSGTRPLSKEVYIERIADLLDIDFQVLECLEKCTKQALMMMEAKIRELAVEAADEHTCTVV